MPATKKLILVVIDGLTADVFEGATESGSAPTLAALAEVGTYARATSFPSLTPVCLASLATGGGPDVHHIPHLVWYHRGERRVVEYGSSFGAMRAVGPRQAMKDAIVEMNAEHLARRRSRSTRRSKTRASSRQPSTFPARGRTRYLLRSRARAAVNGPKRFFYYNLFESDVTGAPLAVRGRAGGSVDAYAAAVGRWLVTRDGFDFLFFYLPDYDFASHALGPGGAPEALGRERQRRRRWSRPRAVWTRSSTVTTSSSAGPRPDVRRPGCSDPGRAVRRPARPPLRLRTARGWSTSLDAAVDARSVAERLRA